MVGRFRGIRTKPRSSSPDEGPAPWLQRVVRTRPAFSLAETMISLVLVSGLLVVSFNTVGATTVGQKTSAERTQAIMLAAARLSDILSKSYEDPTGPVLFGLEADETGIAVADYDDVDDYHNLSETLSGYGSPPPTRTSQVFRAAVANPSTNSVTDTGAKRIVVEIKRGAKILAMLSAVRSGDAPTAGPYILELAPEME